MCAYLANIPRGTEAIWIFSIGITVTPLGQTGALDTLRISRARGIRIISCRITVTPGGEWWLTRTVLKSLNLNYIFLTFIDFRPHLTNFVHWTKAIRIICIGITVTALREALALDTLRVDWTCCIRIISCRVTVTPRGVLGGTAS